MSEIKKLYSKKDKKSTKSLVTKRENRRKAALSAFRIQELLQHLKLQQNNKTLCPKCKEVQTLEIKKREFKCKSCKQKGHTIKLVKLALGISDWKAIAYIESLAKEKVTKLTPKITTKPIPKTNIPILSNNKNRIEKI
ncbi:hypothetical protein [Candidatus Uabimicrobium sp. HlEnr_7]|uniref:hypothetical protein n=1 Tax=Candidatus Uabimicrobium helgolandensis TaxID=3095367 RepID=UPI00355793F2